MEGRLKFVLGIVILVLVVITGRNILVKKAIKKNGKAVTVSKGTEKPAPKTVTADEKVEKNVGAAGESDKKESVPETQVATVKEETPAEVRAVTNSQKISISDLEAEAAKTMCETDWEKGFCQRLMTGMIPAKGTRIVNEQLMIFIDNSTYLARADFYVNPPVMIDPSKPIESQTGPQSGKSVDPQVQDAQKISLAGAILLRQLMQAMKEDLNGRNFVLVFVKNTATPAPKDTFAFFCQGSSVQDFQTDVVLSEDNLKSLKVDYSRICGPI